MKIDHQGFTESRFPQQGDNVVVIKDTGSIYAGSVRNVDGMVLLFCFREADRVLTELGQIDGRKITVCPFFKDAIWFDLADAVEFQEIHYYPDPDKDAIEKGDRENGR